MTRPDDTIPLVLLAVITFVLWLPHFYLSTRQWVVERSPRAFRGAYIAVMLQIGMLRIVTSAAARAWPAEWIQALNVLTAPILTVALISGALVSAYTWGRWWRS